MGSVGTSPFNLQFPGDAGCGAAFPVLIWHLDVFFRKRSVEVFYSFFNWVINFLIVDFEEFFAYFGWEFMAFAKIFSQSAAFRLILLRMPFVNIFILTESSYLQQPPARQAPWCIAPSVLYLKRSQPRSSGLPPSFSPNDFPYRSMIRYEWGFGQRARSRSRSGASSRASTDCPLHRLFSLVHYKVLITPMIPADIDT